MEEPNWTDPEAGKMNGAQFFAELIEAFPALEEDISWHDADQLHARMEEFSRFANVLIAAGESQEIVRCFTFIESRLPLVNADMENAISVSFCESLLTENTPEDMTKSVALMPPNLRSVYLAYKKHFEE